MVHQPKVSINPKLSTEMVLQPQFCTKNPKLSTETKDRLSNLPNHILHHILSFLNTKFAFQTATLSKRWKNLSNNLQTLRISSKQFKSIKSFSESLTRILSLRDDSTALHTVDFLHLQDCVDPEILKTTLKYAVSHHVQRLRVCITCDLQQFSACMFSSQTLTSLELSIHFCINNQGNALFPNSLNLPALTNLTLSFFNFGADNDGCAEPFSVFKKLKTLILQQCRLVDAQILCISSATLVNLTIRDYHRFYKYKYKYELSALSLSNFAFAGPLSNKLFLSHHCSVKHVCIDARDIRLINRNVEEDSAVLLSWLQELVNIKSLTVSSNTLQVLSFYPDLFKVKLTSLCNLESLKVEMKPLTCGLYMISEYGEFRKYYKLKKSHNLKEAAFIPKGVVEFLIQNSPLAKVNIIPFDD